MREESEREQALHGSNLGEGRTMTLGKMYKCEESVLICCGNSLDLTDYTKKKAQKVLFSCFMGLLSIFFPPALVVKLLDPNFG